MQQTVYMGMPDDSVRTVSLWSVLVAKANNPVFSFFSLAVVCWGGKICQAEFGVRKEQQRERGE